MVGARAQGLSMIELLAGLVILSILVSLAAPSFSRMLAEQRLRQAGSELRISLATARSEAVKRNQGVSVIAHNSGWSAGWCVEADGADSCTTQPIQEFNIASGLVTIQRDGASTGVPVSFNAWGRVQNCPEFLLTTAAAGSACTLCLVVTTDGRVESHTGDCPESCDTQGAEMSRAGSCT